MTFFIVPVCISPLARLLHSTHLGRSHRIRSPRNCSLATNLLRGSNCILVSPWLLASLPRKDVRVVVRLCISTGSSMQPRFYDEGVWMNHIVR
ncbi:hypothetical protein F4819DRAFT_449152 [Hypoxylon fuscum]|nr:hypothetical protein F4819DRAFT_449152 [Hypoxylon fuscum]